MLSNRLHGMSLTCKTPLRFRDHVWIYRDIARCHLLWRNYGEVIIRFLTSRKPGCNNLIRIMVRSRIVAQTVFTTAMPFKCHYMSQLYYCIYTHVVTSPLNFHERVTNITGCWGFFGFIAKIQSRRINIVKSSIVTVHAYQFIVMCPISPSSSCLQNLFTFVQVNRT